MIRGQRYSFFRFKVAQLRIMGLTAALALATLSSADLLIDDFSTGETGGTVNAVGGNWNGFWQSSTVPGDVRSEWAWNGTSFSVGAGVFNWQNGNNNRYNSIDGACYIEYGAADLPPGAPTNPIDLNLTQYSALRFEFASNDQLKLRIQFGSGPTVDNRSMLIAPVNASAGSQIVDLQLSDFVDSLGSGVDELHVEWLSFNFMMNQNTEFSLDRIQFLAVPEPTSFFAVGTALFFYCRRRRKSP